VKYIIWSNEHQAWWRPKSRGYTRWIEDAGRYDAKEAKAICNSGDMDTEQGSRKCEFMLPAPECMTVED
jgi:hypothetical protein